MHISFGRRARQRTEFSMMWTSILLFPIDIIKGVYASCALFKWENEKEFQHTM